MKTKMNKTIKNIFCLTLLAASFGTVAHDPKEHLSDEQPPNCAAMKDMKMDMKDPVAKATMAKCMKDMHRDGGQAQPDIKANSMKPETTDHSNHGSH